MPWSPRAIDAQRRVIEASGRDADREARRLGRGEPPQQQPVVDDEPAATVPLACRERPTRVHHAHRLDEAHLADVRRGPATRGRGPRAPRAGTGGRSPRPRAARRRRYADVAREEAAAVVVEDAVLVERVERRRVGSTRHPGDRGASASRTSRAAASQRSSTSTSSSVNATTGAARVRDAEVPRARRPDARRCARRARVDRRPRRPVASSRRRRRSPRTRVRSRRTRRAPRARQVREQLGAVLRRDDDGDVRPAGRAAQPRRVPPAHVATDSRGRPRLEEPRGERRRRVGRAVATPAAPSRSRSAGRGERAACAEASADVPHRVEDAVDAVGDDLGRPAGVGDEHGAARAHRLDHHLAERLGLDRGVHEHVGVGQHRTPRPRRSRVSSDAIVEPERVGERRERRGVVVLPEQRHADDRSASSPSPKASANASTARRWPFHGASLPDDREAQSARRWSDEAVGVDRRIERARHDAPVARRRPSRASRRCWRPPRVGSTRAARRTRRAAPRGSVRRLEPVADVPDARHAREACGRAAVEGGLERVRVHDVGPQPAQPPREAHDVASRVRARARRDAARARASRCIVRAGASSASTSTLAPAASRRPRKAALLAEDRVDAARRPEAADGAGDRELATREHGGVVEHDDARRALGRPRRARTRRRARPRPRAQPCARGRRAARVGGRASLAARARLDAPRRARARRRRGTACPPRRARAPRRGRRRRSPTTGVPHASDSSTTSPKPSSATDGTTVTSAARYHVDQRVVVDAPAEAARCPATPSEPRARRRSSRRGGPSPTIASTSFGPGVERRPGAEQHLEPHARHEPAHREHDATRGRRPRPARAPRSPGLKRSRSTPGATTSIDHGATP